MWNLPDNPIGSLGPYAHGFYDIGGSKPGDNSTTQKPAKPATTTTSSNSNNSSGSSGSSSSSGTTKKASSANADLIKYLVWYARTKMGVKHPDMKAIHQIAKLNLTSSLAVARYRQIADNYKQSGEYKARIADFNSSLQTLGINPKLLPARVGMGYVLGPYSKGQLYGYLRGHAGILKQAGYDLAGYFKGQQDVALPDLLSRSKDISAIWQQKMGRPMNRQEFNYFFNNNLTPEEVSQHADLVLAGNQPTTFMEGQGLTKAEGNAMLFNAKTADLSGEQLRQRTAAAIRTKGGLLSSTKDPFAVSKNETDQMVQTGL